MERTIKLDENGINWRNQMMRHAKYYAKDRGWCIIPLHTPIFPENGKPVCSCGIEDCSRIGKHPRVSKWQEKATTDLKVIKSWFDEWPDMNIGVATGPKSGVAVLDADGVRGKRSLLSVPPIPKTAIVKSGIGYHYYFDYPEVDVKTVANVLPGLDSRGIGGYVCAPPSLHYRGYRYVWEQAEELAPIPNWWLDKVEKPQLEQIEAIKYDVQVNNDQLDSYGRVALQNELSKLYSTPVGRGMRNQNLNRAAFSLGQLVASGVLSEELVRGCLWEAATNGMLMEPEEARKTMESGLRGGLLKPRVVMSR